MSDKKNCRYCIHYHVCKMVSLAFNLDGEMSVEMSEFPDNEQFDRKPNYIADLLREKMAGYCPRYVLCEIEQAKRVNYDRIDRIVKDKLAKTDRRYGKRKPKKQKRNTR